MKPLPPKTIDVPMIRPTPLQPQGGSDGPKRSARSCPTFPGGFQTVAPRLLGCRSQGRRKRFLKLSGFGLDVELALGEDPRIAPEALPFAGIGGEPQDAVVECGIFAGLHDGARL